MSSSLFPGFPADARLWIYIADRPLAPYDQDVVQRHLSTFFDQWTAHGHRVEGEARILHERFLLIAATVQGGDLSGCGIDASTHVLRSIAQEIDLEWLPALNVCYRDDAGQIQTVTRPAFRSAAREGTVDADTPVFDTSITSLGDLRDGDFEKAAADSWHARVFRLGGPVAA